MFTAPVGPEEACFYWPEAILGNFCWPAASGSPLVPSPAMFTYKQIKHLALTILKQNYGSEILKVNFLVLINLHAPNDIKCLMP